MPEHTDWNAERRTHGGDGSMIGMVVDEYEQPFVHGALIRLPELGKAYESNAEGFFMTDQLPAGSYRVEWVVDGTVVGVGGVGWERPAFRRAIAGG